MPAEKKKKNTFENIFEGCLKFTYDGYRVFLNYLRKKYQFVTFNGFRPNSDSQLILRHDIDGSLYPALRMAKIEKEMNIKSTFFVLLSTKYYNLFEEDSLAMLREIIKMGHEIGLHYDVLQYENIGLNFNRMLEMEINLLEEILDISIKAIARHNISKSNLDPFLDLEFPQNAYNPLFIKKSLYVSDSCRAWYLDDLKKLLSFDSRNVQLLIHPMLWAENECSREEILMDFFDEIKSNIELHRGKWLDFWYSTTRVKKYQKEIDLL